MSTERALAVISVLALACVMVAGLFGSALAVQHPVPEEPSWFVTNWE